MKRNLKLFTIISLFIVAISFVSCSKNDDPADNDIYNPQIEIVSPAETKQYFNIFILKNEMV